MPPDSEAPRVCGGERKSVNLVISSVVALAASILAIVLSILTYCRTFTMWEEAVSVEPPAGYAVIRGLWHPSDHLLVPLIWTNTGRRPALVRELASILTPRHGAQHAPAEPIRFSLAGEYATLAPSGIGKELSSMRTSLLLPGYSTEERFLVFHVQSWWDETAPTYRFRFREAQDFDVYVEYRVYDQPLETRFLFVLPLFSSVEKLELPGDPAPQEGDAAAVSGPHWDYWDLPVPSSTRGR